MGLICQWVGLVRDRIEFHRKVIILVTDGGDSGICQPISIVLWSFLHVGQETLDQFSVSARVRGEKLRCVHDFMSLFLKFNRPELEGFSRAASIKVLRLTKWVC